MKKMLSDMGAGSLVVIFITLILFIAALFVKGFTHDLLLEAAVFLVSVKLIILSYKNAVGVEALHTKLDLILSEEQHLEKVLSEMRNTKVAEKKSA